MTEIALPGPLFSSTLWVGKERFALRIATKAQSRALLLYPQGRVWARKECPVPALCKSHCRFASEEKEWNTNSPERKQGKSTSREGQRVKEAIDHMTKSELEALLKEFNEALGGSFPWSRADERAPGGRGVPPLSGDHNPSCRLGGGHYF